MEQLRGRVKWCRSQYLEALAARPEAQAGVKPAGGGWCMLECAEHVALVELGLFRRIISQSTLLREETGRHREELFLAHGLDRSRKISAPEPAQPAGRFATLAEAGAAFAKYRDRTIGWVETCGEYLRLHAHQHPVIGTMPAYHR